MNNMYLNYGKQFDTAQLYENKKIVGKILSESSVKRSELF